MSINHLIYSQATPKYNLYCNDLSMQGDLNINGVISTPLLNCENVNATQQVRTGSITLTGDSSGREQIASIPYLSPFGATDGFGGGGLTPAQLVNYVVKKTETLTGIVGTYQFQFNATSVLNATEYKINFLPVGLATAQNFDITNLDFRVMDQFAGVGMTTTPRVVSLDPSTLTISSLLVLGSITTGNKEVFISITTSEDK
jgi:hypothetical protein